jgi:hypothetical protein
MGYSWSYLASRTGYLVPIGSHALVPYSNNVFPGGIAEQGIWSLLAGIWSHALVPDSSEAVPGGIAGQRGR